PRRGLGHRVLTVVALGALGWWLVTGPVPALLREADLPWLDGVVAGRVPEPAPDVAALADEMHLTAHGRDLLYRARPELLGATEFAGRCDRPHETSDDGGAVGCYVGPGGTDVLHAGGSIVVYRPTDARLRGFVVETAAHELLHAAWTDLTAAERAEAGPLLEEVVAGIDPADQVHAQIAASVGPYPANRGTELFAYVGTQVWQPGGLGDRLEVLYARYVADREALVAVHTGLEAMLGTVRAELDAAQGAFRERRTAHAVEQAQHDADVATLASYRTVLEQQEAQLAAMSASEQSRLRLSWTWRDGTVLASAPAAQTIARARELLARDEAELTARAGTLQALAAELAAQEAHVAAMRADANALWAQLDPPGG
ncbi:hypothetical protein, partial [Cellulomonas sp. B6]|uniref:hypothetical protein n=1 Tax=Cellulomonas sp. B6 TaxID=1295626 RepID=UPI000A435BBC